MSQVGKCDNCHRRAGPAGSLEFCPDSAELGNFTLCGLRDSIFLTVQSESQLHRYSISGEPCSQNCGTSLWWWLCFWWRTKLSSDVAGLRAVSISTDRGPERSPLYLRKLPDRSKSIITTLSLRIRSVLPPLIATSHTRNMSHHLLGHHWTR